MSGVQGPTLGLYVSIPFCRSKCTYCNFASGVYPVRDHARYIRRVVAELAQAKAWAEELKVELPRQVDTIYLGGGTPSLLAPELVAELFQGIRGEFDVDQDAEITVECAPAQIEEATLEALVAAGMNRASFGVQSFIDREAQWSGRKHTRADVERDIARLRAAGVGNLNVDLIAGLPGQTAESWQESLEALVASGVPHASLYMLEVDEDSRLGRELLDGGNRYHAGKVPEDEQIADLYEEGVVRLGAAGIGQYEISNLGRTGFEARHNLRYWERKPYLGVGLDASSMLRALPAEDDADELPYVLRSKTCDDLKTYIDGKQPAETAWLSPDRQHEEAWFLGLRLNRGVRFAALEQEFGVGRVAPARKAAARLAEDGLLEGDAELVRLSPRGRLLSNEVFAEFLELEG
jgi:oxygen-independent coproporphyrinogen-3 oxidase